MVFIPLQNLEKEVTICIGVSKENLKKQKEANLPKASKMKRHCKDMLYPPHSLHELNE